jgi:hypothetical protein
MKTPTQELRNFAARLPETSEGVACKGTSLEKTTFKVKNKAFLFLGVADAMLKLRDSLAEAKTIAAKSPNQCKAGANGWVSLKFDDNEVVPLDVLKRWVKESYQLFATPRSKTKPKPATKKADLRS